ncbi:MAG: DegT/DnrJ/EryC1/StrS family aminotransferase [Chloroflexi bacterium]|nr:DegT/DnrJ/EryC1/StrS family aminotransferase [Chloroflexota bacterium]
MKIPYTNIAAQHVRIKNEILSAVGNVLDHGKFILGNEVEEFECRFADLCKVSYAIGVNSGTDALILALRSLGIGPGDEVITVPNSFVASTSCVALVGARPVFVDVRDDYNIDPSMIEQAITSRTRAILPVHLTGRPANMTSIMEIAKAHDLDVIEDCAQAVCAEYERERVGSFGTIGCFSLHPLKTLNACGDGGVLTTNDPRLYERLRKLRNVGLHNRDECHFWGYNSRLDTMQSAILLIKLHYVEEWTEIRRAYADYYRRRLNGLPQVQVPNEKSNERCVYHTYVIQADRRDELKDYLGEHGIDTKIHYPIPIHLQQAAKYLEYTEGQFPVTERLASKILSLPIYPELRIDELEYIATTVCSFYDTEEE